MRSTVNTGHTHHHMHPGAGYHDRDPSLGLKILRLSSYWCDSPVEPLAIPPGRGRAVDGVCREAVDGPATRASIQQARGQKGKTACGTQKFTLEAPTKAGLLQSKGLREGQLRIGPLSVELLHLAAPRIDISLYIASPRSRKRSIQILIPIPSR